MRLANEHRLQIIEHLLDGPCNVMDMAEALNTHQSNISRNAKDLYDANILSRAKDGINIVYKIRCEFVESIVSAVRREVS
jgi:DNA-binding transcriptional ArsR family regulator